MPYPGAHQVGEAAATTPATEGQVTDAQVAAYLAKYATKSTEITGHVSARLSEDTMTVRTIEPLWTADEVSSFLGVPVSTLYQWRYRRVGPGASRVGRHLRYDPADVRAWLAKQAGSS